VLQSVAVCCSLLQCSAECGRMLQCVTVAGCCRVLQGVAGCSGRRRVFSVLQCVAKIISVKRLNAAVLYRVAKT